MYMHWLVHAQGKQHFLACTLPKQRYYCIPGGSMRNLTLL
jgi:hypothetical protein